MWAYFVRRLILLPITLFAIVLVNFVIVNLAPGEPSSITEISPTGQATRDASRAGTSASDERYLQFREHYGLTLPILFNAWPWISEQTVRDDLWELVHHKYSPEDKQEIGLKEWDDLRIKTGDQARFTMPHLVQILKDPSIDSETLRLAMRMLVRGGTRQAVVGPALSEQDRQYNRQVDKDTQLLDSVLMSEDNTPEQVHTKIDTFMKWYETHEANLNYTPDTWQKIKIFFLDTRFVKYVSRVLTFDFGTLRNDPNKTVTSEVVRRFKYSLTLSILPLLITFVLCQLFGFIMAYTQNRWPDHGINLVCLILYAIPIFVVAPFLIDKVALNGYFPFTHIPIPTSGFTSPDSVYNGLTSAQRFFDVLQHIALPIIAIMYGSLAAQSRLCRTAVLEVLRQDYVRTAKAKGISAPAILFKHVGRNSSITIVTSIAGSLGIVLGGSLIVETIFQINGFGKFFYDAIINRDYNVIMFSTLAGSFLTLIGYLVADIAYTLLDPRITLE